MPAVVSLETRHVAAGAVLSLPGPMLRDGFALVASEAFLAIPAGSLLFGRLTVRVVAGAAPQFPPTGQGTAAGRHLLGMTHYLQRSVRVAFLRHIYAEDFFQE